MTDFGRALYSAPKGDCQGRGAQCRANFPNSEGVKPDEQGRLHATRRQHQHSNHQVDSPKPNFNNNSNSPTTTGTQDIVNPIGPAGPHWISADQNLKTFIDELFDKNSGPRPSFSRVIGSELMGDPRVNVNLCIGMHFGSDFVIIPNPNSVNFGVASVNAKDKLESVSATTTRVGSSTIISKWRRQGHNIEEVTLERVSKGKLYSDYILKMSLKL